MIDGNSTIFQTQFLMSQFRTLAGESSHRRISMVFAHQAAGLAITDAQHALEASKGSLPTTAVEGQRFAVSGELKSGALQLWPFLFSYKQL